MNVGFSKDFKDALRQEVDRPFSMPRGGFTENFMELVDGLAKPGDILITKGQLDELICARMLQGIAGGLLAPMTQMMIARVAGKHMARVMGYTVVPVLIAPS